MYHFVLGFISKLVGTEVGIIEPITSFSLCFGAAFMPHKMNVYAELFMRNGNVSSCRVGIPGQSRRLRGRGYRQQRLTIWSLGLASVLTVALGYPSDLLVRWFWWALAMVPF